METHNLTTMIKRILTTLVSGLIAVAAAAQITADSTKVQIRAYWEVGDSYTYNYSEDEYKIQGSDTLEFATIVELHKYEVLAKTDSTYSMKLTYLDTYSSDADVNFMDSLYLAKYGPTEVLFTTDKYGTLQSVDNIQELTLRQQEFLPAYVDRIFSTNPEEYADASKEELLTSISPLMSEDIVQKTILEHLGLFLCFHGTQMEIGRIYSYEEELPSILPTVDVMVDATTYFCADEEYTDEYSAFCIKTTEVDSDDMVQKLIEYIVSADPEFKSLKKKEQKETIKKLKDVLSSFHIGKTSTSSHEVHLGTGWPLSLHLEEITISMDSKTGMNLQQCKETYLEIILDDEEG